MPFHETFFHYSIFHPSNLGFFDWLVFSRLRGMPSPSTLSVDLFWEITEFQTKALPIIFKNALISFSWVLGDSRQFFCVAGTGAYNFTDTRVTFFITWLRPLHYYRRIAFKWDILGLGLENVLNIEIF